MVGDPPADPSDTGRSVNSPAQTAYALVQAHDLAAQAYVLSADLGLVYQVPKLPYAVLIDQAGILRAKGLVNTREHLESLFEAMERGVGSVQEFVAARPSPVAYRVSPE